MRNNTTLVPTREWMLLLLHLCRLPLPCLLQLQLLLSQVCIHSEPQLSRYFSNIIFFYLALLYVLWISGHAGPPVQRSPPHYKSLEAHHSQVYSSPLFFYFKCSPLPYWIQWHRWKCLIIINGISMKKKCLHSANILHFWWLLEHVQGKQSVGIGSINRPPKKRGGRGPTKLIEPRREAYRPVLTPNNIEYVL